MLQLRRGEVVDDVDVVDHQIEDDADVRRPKLERAEAVALDELGNDLVLANRREGGIESFDVADLQCGVCGSCLGDQRLGAFQVAGDRLLH